MRGLSFKQIAAAELLGITPRALRDMDAPRNPDGTYPGPELVRWWVDRHIAEAGQLSLSQERARLAKAQADKTEIENEVRAGRLMETDRVIREVGVMLGVFRTRILAIPDALGQLFDPATAQRVVVAARARVHEALAEISQYRPDDGDGRPD